MPDPPTASPVPEGGGVAEWFRRGDETTHCRNMVGMFDHADKPSWRLSAWLFDRAVAAEGDTDHPDWPQSWTAKAWSTAGMVVQSYWLRRYVWQRWLSR